MTEFEHINCLIAEVVEIYEVPQVLRIRPEQWGLIFDENLQIVIGFDRLRKCLSFSCEIGCPAVGQRLETYEQLLVYASLDTQTGGVRVALDSPGGSLLLLLDMFVEDLDSTTLAEVLEQYIVKVNLWRKAISKGPQTHDDSSLNSAPQLPIDTHNLFV